MTYKPNKKVIDFKNIFIIFKDIFVFCVLAIVILSFVYVIEFSSFVSSGFYMNQLQKQLKQNAEDNKVLTSQLSLKLSQISLVEVSKQLNLIPITNISFLKQSPTGSLSLSSDDRKTSEF